MVHRILILFTWVSSHKNLCPINHGRKIASLCLVALRHWLRNVHKLQKFLWISGQRFAVHIHFAVQCSVDDSGGSLHTCLTTLASCHVCGHVHLPHGTVPHWGLLTAFRWLVWAVAHEAPISATGRRISRIFRNFLVSFMCMCNLSRICVAYHMSVKYVWLVSYECYCSCAVCVGRCHLCSYRMSEGIMCGGRGIGLAVGDAGCGMVVPGLLCLHRRVWWCLWCFLKIYVCCISVVI